MATYSPEPGEIVESAGSASEQSRAQSVEIADPVHKQTQAGSVVIADSVQKQSPAGIPFPKELFLLQKNAATIFQKLQNRFRHDKTSKFWSRVANDEQTRRKYTEAKVAFELEADEMPDSVPGKSSVESSEMTLCKRCCCAQCRKRKRKPDKIERLHKRLQSFNKNAVRNIKTLIKEYWINLEAGPTRIIDSRSVLGEPKNIIRLNHHLALLQMAKDDHLRWLWRALALMRNLRSHEDFLSESGYMTEEQRESQVARDEYIRYMYHSQILSKKAEKEARTALTEQLRYGKRWKIFVLALTTGFLLVCGGDLATKVIQRTTFTTELLRMSADQIKQSNVARLCEELSPLGDQLLENGRLDGKQNNRRSVLKAIEMCIRS